MRWWRSINNLLVQGLKVHTHRRIANLLYVFAKVFCLASSTRNAAGDFRCIGFKSNVMQLRAHPPFGTILCVVGAWYGTIKQDWTGIDWVLNSDS